MTEAEVRELLEKAYEYYEREAEQLRDPNLPVLDFKRFYREELPEDARRFADQVMGEWVLSGDEGRRFMALAVIDELRIVSAVPALRTLADRFEQSEDWSAPFSWEKVNGIVGRLTSSGGPAGS